MKTFLFALAVLIVSTQVSRAASLSSLECYASNGVTMKGTESSAFGLKLKTYWGVFQKNFLASVGQGSTSEMTIIDLISDKGTEYKLALNGGLLRARTEQVTTGTVLQPSENRDMPPTILAYVRCTLKLR
ncbi:MAG TPA: hypothetical protein VIH99_06745 [Bdellovibrionota bacterium]|jgi:hypothetical protein